METYGPLHISRFNIFDAIKDKIKTGDILYRRGDSKGPLGLPFSRLVCRLTNSKFSHAAMILINDDKDPIEAINVIDINEDGCEILRFIDWVDNCVTTDLEIVRLKGLTSVKVKQIESILYKILDNDPDYNYTFEELNKYYCTECVNYVANCVGIKICEPQTIWSILPIWLKPIVWTINRLFKMLGQRCMPLYFPIYFVGNYQQGMLSSQNTISIYSHGQVS